MSLIYENSATSLVEETTVIFSLNLIIFYCNYTRYLRFLVTPPYLVVLNIEWCSDYHGEKRWSDWTLTGIRLNTISKTCIWVHMITQEDKYICSTKLIYGFFFPSVIEELQQLRPLYVLCSMSDKDWNHKLMQSFTTWGVCGELCSLKGLLPLRSRQPPCKSWHVLLRGWKNKFRKTWQVFYENQ